MLEDPYAGIRPDGLAYQLIRKVVEYYEEHRTDHLAFLLDEFDEDRRSLAELERDFERRYDDIWSTDNYEDKRDTDAAMEAEEAFAQFMIETIRTIEGIDGSESR